MEVVRQLHEGSEWLLEDIKKRSTDKDAVKELTVEELRDAFIGYAVKKSMMQIQEKYLNKYEIHLIKQILGAKHKLAEYYRVLLAADLTPWAHQVTTYDLMNFGSDEDDILKDHLTDVYEKEFEVDELNKVQIEILDIVVKDKTKESDHAEQIADMIKMDRDVKEMIFTS